MRAIIATTITASAGTNNCNNGPAIRILFDAFARCDHAKLIATASGAKTALAATYDSCYQGYIIYNRLLFRQPGIFALLCVSAERVRVGVQKCRKMWFRLDHVYVPFL